MTISSLRNAFRQFLRFQPMLKPHRPRLVGAAGCMFGVIATGLLAPWPVQAVVDGVLLGHRDSGVLRMLGPMISGNPKVLLLACCIAVLMITAVRGACTWGQNLLTASVGHRLVADLRLAIFNRLQTLSLTFHGRARTGDLLVRMTGDVSMLREVLVPALLDTTSKVLIIVGMLGLMVVLDPKMTLIPLLMLPVIALSSLRFGRKIRTQAHKQRRKEGKIASIAGEALASVTMVQVYSREQSVGDQFASQNRRSLRAGLRTLKLQESLSRIVEMTLAAGTCGVLWMAGTRALQGTVSPGELLVYLAYLKSLFKPMQSLVRMTGKIGKAVACGDRVLEVLDSKEQVMDLPDAEIAPLLKGEIVFDQVTFGYVPGDPVLKNVSFRIAPGDKVGIVGPSGSGKSTILALLMRLYEPQQGRILVDGRDIRSMKLDSYRKQIGVVLQEPFLIGESVADNILHGKPGATTSEVTAAGRAAGADRFIRKLPDGYDSYLGERGTSISRGQQQRIALARMVVRDAPVLVFDEPTTGLDSATETEVVQTLARLTQGKSCLWIAHNLNQILGCRRVLVLRDGRIVEQGSPVALLKKQSAFRVLFAGVLA